jgi:hypothetical protein
MMNGQAFELVITMTPDGQVGVRGPIDQLVLCYGLLELARDAIQARAAEMAKQRIVPASILPPNGHIRRD